MKLLISGSELSSVVPWLTKVTDPRTPSRSGIKLTAAEHVSLSATNGESFATATPPATVLDEGTALVSARGLDAIAKALGKSEVTVSSDGSRVTIERGATRWTLPELDGEGRPRFPTLGEELGRIPGEVLKEGLRQVLPVVVTGKDVPEEVEVTTGVEFTFGETLILAASDRRRVAAVELDWQRALTTQDHALVVPASLLTVPMGILNTEEVRLHTDGNLMGFATDTNQVFGRLFAAPFLRWRGILPNRDDAFTSVTVNVAELVARVKDASAFSRDEGDHLRLDCTPDEITLTSCNEKDEDGESSLVPEGFIGQSISVWCQPHFLADALKRVPAETVVLTFGEYPWNGIVLRSLEGDGYRHMLGTLKNPAARAWAEAA